MFPNSLFPPKLFAPKLFGRSPSIIVSVSYGGIFSDQLFAPGLFSPHIFSRLDTDPLSPSITQTLIFSETLSTASLTQSITQTLTFTQSVANLGLTQSLSDTLFFTDSISGGLDEYGGPFNNEIFPDQIFSHHVFPLTLFTHGVNTYPVLFRQRLNFTALLNGTNPANPERNIDQTLFLQDYFRTQLGSFHYHFQDYLIFEPVLTYVTKPQKFVTIEDLLIFNDSEIVHTILRRSFLDHLLLNQDNIHRNIEGIKITVPGLVGTVTNKKARYVVLQGMHSVIILPSPLFGDTQSNIAEIKINRAVTGKRYTYIKTTQRQRIKYKFEIKRQKSNELRIFLNDNDLDWIYITNWRGEMYYGRLVNNPFSFTAISRDGICSNNLERHTIELEFEGYLLISQMGPCE